MESSDTLTLSLPADVADRLDRVAKDSRVSRSALALRALTAWLEDEEAKRAAIIEGLEQVQSGRTIPDAKVRAWLRSWGTENELPPPVCE